MNRIVIHKKVLAVVELKKFLDNICSYEQLFYSSQRQYHYFSVILRP